MDKIIKIELKVQEIDVVLAAISKMPLCDVFELFNKIKTQAVEQLQEQPVEVLDKK